jgi:hypothetical protein
MGDDSDEEAELRAALAAFGDNGGSSNSDSDDDDGISKVDTSAVARILAARQSSDASDFGALADALQTAAVATDADAEDDTLANELQVTAARACAHCSLRRSPV